jgi:hypothetical protein
MDLRGRDLHLMNLLAFGMFCCVFGPIRDILGEENTPCLFVMVMAALLNIFYLLTLVVRVVRVIAMHFLQTQLAHSLANKELSPLLRPPSEDNVGLQLTARSALSSDGVTMPRSPVAGEAAAASDSAQSSKPNVAPLPIPIIYGDFGQPALNSRGCCSATPYAAYLERLQLHRTRGQLILLAILSLPNIALCLHTAVTQDRFRWDGFGCPGNDAERVFYICLFVAYLSFHLFGLWYVYRRPDAFRIRQEIVGVTVLSFIQCGIILFANSKAAMSTFLGTPHFTVYYGMVTTWIYVYLVFVRPLWRSTPGGAWSVPPTMHVNVAQVVPMSELRSVTEEGAISPHSVKSSSFFASPRLHNTLSLPFAERDSVVYSSRIGQVAAGTGMVGVERRMVRVKGHVLGTLMSFYHHPGLEDKCVSFHYMRRDMETLLRKESNHVYSGIELLQLSALMASIPVGRNRLSSLLSTEWCLELLLFLVDLDTYRRNKGRLTLLWGFECHLGVPPTLADVTASPVSTALLSCMQSGDIAGETPPLPGATKVGVRNVGKLEAFLKSTCDSSSFLAQQYLQPRSPTPLNVAPKTAHAAAALAEECAKIRKQQRYPSEELISKLERVSAAFGVIEKEVLNLIASGPMLRFVGTLEFQEWRQLAIDWVLQAL